MSDELGRYSGKKIKYHRKYWEVATLLKVANASVCANIVVGRDLPARRGRRTVLSVSCGRKASLEKEKDNDVLCVLLLIGEADSRYSSVLYGEKLWRWSRRVR